MRKIILVIVALLTIVFVVYSLTELQNILDTLKKSNLIFILVAFIFEVICLYNTSATFGALYRLVGLEESRWRLFLMTTAANFVNLIAPSGGVGGIAVFLGEARARKIPTGRVMVVGVLYLVYEYAALFCVLLLGFIVLVRRHNLNTAEIIAAGFLLLIALADGTMLFLGYRSSEQLGRLLAWLSRLVNRILAPFFHRDLLKVENAYHFASEVAEGISTIRGSHKNLIWPFLFTLNNKALLICVLAFSFLALNTPFSTGTLVGGFSISYLFFYASPTPSGVGFVEGILPVALNTLLVPFTNAVLITLLFRTMTLWFPLVIGAVAFRILQNQRQVPEKDA
jgi:glycosyltransferase 2 family protein